MSSANKRGEGGGRINATAMQASPTCDETVTKLANVFAVENVEEDFEHVEGAP